MHNVITLLVVGYLLVINVVAFAMMALDKSYAQRKKWRIPEATLLGAAFIGGALGELLGMYILRHKTKHLKFTICVPLFLILQIVLIGYFGFSIYFVAL